MPRLSDPVPPGADRSRVLDSTFTHPDLGIAVRLTERPHTGKLYGRHLAHNREVIERDPDGGPVRSRTLADGYARADALRAMGCIETDHLAAYRS